MEKHLLQYDASCLIVHVAFKCSQKAVSNVILIR